METDDAHNTSGKHRKAAKKDLATGQVGPPKEEPTRSRGQVLDINLIGRRSKGGRGFIYIVENVEGTVEAERLALRLHKSYGSKRGGDATPTRCHTWQIRSPANLVYVMVGDPPEPDSGHPEVAREQSGPGQLPLEISNKDK